MPPFRLPLHWGASQRRTTAPPSPRRAPHARGPGPALVPRPDCATPPSPPQGRTLRVNEAQAREGGGGGGGGGFGGGGGGYGGGGRGGGAWPRAGPASGALPCAPQPSHRSSRRGNP
jgi:hypothetical protein